MSVIIPTHNRAGLLREALASVHAQEPGQYHLHEVIVVADNCTDDTDETIAQFSDTIRVQASCGTAGLARNEGVRVASGEWLAFVDDDDVFLPGKLATLFRHVSRVPGADFLYSDAFLSPEAGVSSVCWGVPSPDLQGLVFSLPAPSTWLVRRDVFQDLGLFDGRVPRVEDRDFVLRAALSGSVTFLPVQEPLVSYRVRPLPVATILGTWRDTRGVLARYGKSLRRELGTRRWAMARFRLDGWYASEVIRASRCWLPADICNVVAG
ncbi:MAG: glycosyltransferase [Dehalococcoidia bacterium]|nr:glycosyltransferase [Dehalococcoidia bacterium]